jgi:CDP-glucose 4,6-dehydratase
MEGLEMSMLSQEAWRGRRVFVTGHTGFKGSWLVAWLHRAGAEVFGYALAPDTTPNLFTAAGIESLCKRSTIADVRDPAALEAALNDAAPDVVLHLAAQPLVRKSYAEPVATFETNVGGTVNLLEAVRKRARPCVVVVVTSDKVYANDGRIWGYRECDPLGGHDPYSASKAAAEVIVSSYRSSFFHPAKAAQHGVWLASGRAGNVIGGGDWSADRIVCDAARAFSKGEPLRLRNPGAVRPWQHVLDPLHGYLVLAEQMLNSPKPLWCDGWNFGPASGTEATVGELSERLASRWPGAKVVDAHDPNQPVEAGLLRISIDKALALLPWRPVWNVDRAVERTSNWYRRYYEVPGRSMLDACLEDITAFEGDAKSAAGAK